MVAAAVLESAVLNTMDDLSNARYLFATKRIVSGKQLAELPDSKFEKLFLPYGEKLQWACKLHRQAVLYVWGGKRGAADKRAAPAGDEADLFELVVGRNQAGSSSTSWTCKVVPNKAKDAVLRVSDDFACVPEDEERALEALSRFGAAPHEAATVHSGPSPGPVESTHDRDAAAGYILLPEKLELAAGRAVLIENSQLVPLSLMNCQPLVPPSVTVTVRVRRIPAELFEAFRDWMDGVEFRALSAEVLDKIDLTWLGDTRNPWLSLFVGKNFFERGQLNKAATCYVASFSDEAMANTDECCFMNEELEDMTGMTLLELREKASVEDAQRKVAEVLKAWYTERHDVLAAIADEGANLTKISPLPWEHAAAIVIADCDTVQLTEAQLHMLLFYAEGLCIHEFGQRLLETDLHAKHQGFLYAGVDSEAASAQAKDPEALTRIRASLLPERAGILRAVCDIAHDLPTAPKHWQQLLALEPVWLSSKRNVVVSDLAMGHLFNPGLRQSHFFARIEQCYQQKL